MHLDQDSEKVQHMKNHQLVLTGGQRWEITVLLFPFMKNKTKSKQETVPWIHIFFKNLPFSLFFFFLLRSSLLCLSMSSHSPLPLMQFTLTPAHLLSQKISLFFCDTKAKRVQASYVTLSSFDILQLTFFSSFCLPQFHISFISTYFIFLHLLKIVV